MNNWPISPNTLVAPLGVVLCDAGAANIILSLRAQLPKPLFICAEGPARKIMETICPEVFLLSLAEVIQQSKMLLTGTGWTSDLEHRARLCAKKAGICTLALIDHWVNYRERFIRNQQEVLPDFIVITDEYAESEARRCFGDVPLVRWPNAYLEAEASRVVKLRKRKTLTPPENILMIMEPTRTIWPGDSQHGEFVAANYFMERLSLLNSNIKDIHIRIRPHPSDPPLKYNDFSRSFAETRSFSISRDQLLAEDIAWADLVVGCESFALVVAIASGVSTMSILPPHAPQCRLPYKELKHLQHILGA